MFVHLLTPRIGAPVELSRINVVTGANNSGKSALLRDIFRLATGRDPGSDQDHAVMVEPVVLEDMQYGGSMQDEELLREQRGQSIRDEHSGVFEGLAGDLRGVCRAAIRNESWNIVKRPVLHARSVLESELPDVMMLRTVFLDEQMLDTAASATSGASPLDPPRNLLQSLQFASDDTRNELDAAFAASFPPLGLRLDDTEWVRLSLRIADEFPELTGDRTADAEAWSALPRIDEAGRGARNFAVLAMSILLLPGRIVMVDEPDASLQPFAARQLGRWLASAVPEQDCQLIVTARSESLIGGLLERSNEVALLRTRREGDQTRIGGASPDLIRDVVKSPSLNTDHVMAALQRGGAMVVERPQQAAALTALSGHRSGADRWDVLTVQRLTQAPPLLAFLRSIGLPAAVIGDLGMLRDKLVFTRILDAVCRGETPPSWLATRDQLNRHVEAMDRHATRTNTEAMEKILDKLQSGDAELGADEAAHHDPWDRITREGIAAIPLNQRSWVEQLLEELKSAGVFFTARGADEELDAEQMESLMKAIQGGQSPEHLAVLLAEVIQYLRHPTAPAASVGEGGAVG